MSSNPQARITVAFPTIGRWPLLREALDSILRTTRGDVRIVVVDNASSDATRVEVPRLARRDPRVLYLRYEERVHPHANWNRCIEAASGSEYLAIFHDDDLYDPRILDEEIEFLDRNPSVGFVGTGYWVINEHKKVVRASASSSAEMVVRGSDYIQQLYRRAGSFILCSSVMYRRAALAEVRFDSNLDPRGGDTVTFLRIAERWDVGYIGRRLMYYRRHRAQGYGVQGAASAELSLYRNLLGYLNGLVLRDPKLAQAAGSGLHSLRRRLLGRLLSHGLEECRDVRDRLRFASCVAEVVPSWGAALGHAAFLAAAPLKRLGVFRGLTAVVLGAVRAWGRSS